MTIRNQCLGITISFYGFFYFTVSHVLITGIHQVISPRHSQ